MPFIIKNFPRWHFLRISSFDAELFQIKIPRRMSWKNVKVKIIFQTWRKYFACLFVWGKETSIKIIHLTTKFVLYLCLSLSRLEHFFQWVWDNKKMMLMMCYCFGQQRKQTNINIFASHFFMFFCLFCCFELPNKCQWSRMMQKSA